MRARTTIAGALAALLLVFAAGCGDSPEDNAHDSGKKVGEALRQIADADSVDSVQAGVADLRKAVGDVSDDVSSRVRSQARVQQDTLNGAIGAFKQSVTATDPDAKAAAKSELQGQIQDLRTQASSSANTRDSVTNAFWDGVKDGYDG
jgi:gas vesicle protein